MKSFEFDESMLSDPQAIGKQLFSNQGDPRSTAYVRILNRPKINWGIIALKTLLPLALAAILGIGLYHITSLLLIAIFCPIALLLVYAMIFAKSAAICMIKIYQRYAPDSIRKRCRFEPSCSQYAIMSIEKYGFIKGVNKTFNRLGRCNPKGGGYDYP